MQLKATLVSITTENGTLRGELEALSADYARVSGAKAEVDRVVDRLRHELAEQLEQAAAMEAQLEEATKERKVTSFTGISAAVQTDGAMTMLPPPLSSAPLTPAATPHAASGQKMTEIIRKRNQEVAECKARIAQLEQELARQTSANEPKRGRQSLVDMRPPGIAMGIQAVPNSKTQSAQTDGADATPPLPSTAVLPSTALLEKLSADLEKLSSDDGLRQRRDASATTTFASTPRPTVFSSVSTAFSLSLYSIVLWSFGALVGVWLVASLLRANVIRVRDGMEPHPFDAVAATDDWINAYSSAIGGRGLNTLKFEPYDLGLDDDTEANDGEAEKGWVGALLDWVRHGKDEEAETQEDDGRNALPVYRGEPTMDSGIPV